MKKTKVPNYRGELDPNRQKRGNKPLPTQLTVFDRGEFVPSRKQKHRGKP